MKKIIYLFTILLLASIASAQSLNNGLIAYFDGTNNNTDISGNAHHAAIYSSNLLKYRNTETPLNGYYYNWSGAGTNIDTGLGLNSSLFNYTNGWTVNFWYRRVNSSTPASLFDAIDTSNSVIQCGWRGDLQGTPENTCWNGDHYTNVEGLKMNSSTWFMFTIVVQPNKMVNVSINGTSTSLGSAGEPNIPISENVTIGRYGQSSFASMDHFDIDEISVWNRPLSQSNITYLYNQGTGKFCSGGNPCSFDFVAFEDSLTISATDREYATTIYNMTVTIQNTTHVLTGSTQNGSLIFTSLINNTNYQVNFTSNDTGGYFAMNRTINVTGPNSTSFIAWQTEVSFVSNQDYTNKPLTRLNATTGSISNTSTTNITTLYMKGGINRVVSLNVSNQFNETIIFNLSALSSYRHVVNFSDARINFTLMNAVTNETVTFGFDVTLKVTNATGTISYSTSSMFLNNTRALKGYTIEATGSASGLSVAAKNFSIVNAMNLLTIFGQLQSSVHVEIWDELLNVRFWPYTALQNETVKLEFIGPLTINYSTNNGTLDISNLQTGDYEIRYSAPSFNKRSYFFSLPTNGSASLVLYLLNSSVATLVVPVITDEIDQPINGSILKVLKSFISEGGTYKTVEMSRSNFNGEAPIHVILNSQDYRLIVEDDGNILFTSDDTKITSQTLFIQILTSGTPYRIVEGMNGITSLFTASNTNGNVSATFGYNDATNFGTGSCLVITKYDAKRGDTLLCNQCTTGPSTILTCNVNTTGQVSVKGFINTTDDNTFKVAEENFILTQNTIRGYGLMLSFMLFSAIAIGSMLSPSLAVLGAVAGIGFSAFVGYLDVTISSVLGLLFCGLVIIWRKSR